MRTRIAFDRHSCYSTGDRNWLSGESRIRSPPQIAKKGQYVPARWLAIAALTCACLAFLSVASYVFTSLMPVFFYLALTLATLAAFAGERWFTLTALTACFIGLIVYASTVSFHGEQEAAWRVTAVAGFVAPVTGLFFTALRAKSGARSYVLPGATLVLVLAGLQVLDLLKLGADWGWQDGGEEPAATRLLDESCVSDPDALCVLDLAEREGLPAEVRQLVIERIDGVASGVVTADRTIHRCSARDKRLSDTNYGHARSLVVAAIARIDSGQRAEASERLDLALVQARQLSNGPLLNPDHWRDRALAMIAPIRAAAGDLEAAFETYRNIDDVAWRNRALRDIAMVRAHDGAHREALRNVSAIEDQLLRRRPSFRARSLGDLASALGSHAALPDHGPLNWCALISVYDIECGISCSLEAHWSASF